MSWKLWVTLALFGAAIFLPPRFREWIAPACLSVGAGIFWGFLLICIPLRKIFEVDEDPAVAASLVFALIFVVIFTRKLKAELQKVSSK